MDGVQRGVSGGAYEEEPRRTAEYRSHLNIREMDLAAVGVSGGCLWEPRLSSRPALMFSKAANAAVWGDLNDILPRVRLSTWTASCPSWTIRGDGH